jgi:hypothetical protein
MIMPSPTIITANVSNIKIDGEVVPGLQAIEYKIVRNRSNVHAIGSEERLAQDTGNLYVTGSFRVKSTDFRLDKWIVLGIDKPETFQIVIELKKSGIAQTTIAFDECTLEGKTFSMDANGVGMSDYAFTSTRISGLEAS